MWETHAPQYIYSVVCSDGTFNPPIGALLLHIVGEAVFALYLGTSCTRTAKCFLDSDGLQCVKLSLPVGHLTGGDLFHLHFES